MYFWSPKPTERFQRKMIDFYRFVCDGLHGHNSYIWLNPPHVMASPVKHAMSIFSKKEYMRASKLKIHCGWERDLCPTRLTSKHKIKCCINNSCFVRPHQCGASTVLITLPSCRCVRICSLPASCLFCAGVTEAAETVWAQCSVSWEGFYNQACTLGEEHIRNVL